MATHEVEPLGRTLAFEAYGVPISIEVSHAAILPRVEGLLPPGSRTSEPGPDDHRFRLLSDDDGVTFRVESYGRSMPGSVEVEVVLAILHRQIRSHVAQFAPDRVFVHAGVVARGGRAVLIPGMSFSGKTTLVFELIHAGAEYYSDEYAVLDPDGLVHPYAKPLSLRSSNGSFRTDQPVDEIGGTTGEAPLPVGLVVVTEYRPDATWEPRRLTAGEGVLALLANTVTAQDRPDEALGALSKALKDAVILDGDRGEASEIAPRVLELLGD